MVEKVYLKSIALFVISLVIMIPVYSSYVMADLTVERIYTTYDGKDIKDYAKDNFDTIKFEVMARIAGETVINPSQVRVMGGTSTTGVSFGNCIVLSGGYYRCTLSTTLTGYRICDNSWDNSPTSIPPPFTIYLYKNDGSLDDYRQADFWCDRENPVIMQLSLQGGKTVFGPGDNNVIFEYLVSDTACKDPIGNPCLGYSISKCSGFKKLVFNGGGLYNYEVPLNTNPGAYCGRYPGTGIGYANIPVSKFNEGQVTVTARVYDNFGYESAEISRNFVIDKTAPKIESFSIVKSGTSDEPSYILSTRIPVNIKVTITEASSGLDVSTVKADLSGIGLGSDVSPNGGCSLIGTTYECTWNNFNALFTQTSYTVTIKASDIAGNIATPKTFTKTIKEDTNPPKLYGLLSIKCAETRCSGEEIKDISIKGTEQVTVEANLSDVGTGIDISRGIYADLSQLNPSRTDYSSKIGSCFDQGNNIVKCVWNNIYLDISEGGTKNIPFVVYDLLGKTDPNLKGSYTFSSNKIDSRGPVVKDISMYDRNKDSNGFYYIGTSQNKVKVTLEDSVGFANKNDVFIRIGSSSIQATGCSKSSYWVCNFSISASYNGIIKVHQDTADDFGNKVQNPDEIELKFKYDKLAPALAGNKENHVSVVSTYPGGSGYFVNDYGIKIRVNITEANPSLKAYAIFPEEDGLFTSDGKNVTGTCTDSTQGNWKCEWGYSDGLTIQDATPGIKIIKFQFVDIAGNVYDDLDDLSYPITVMELRDIYANFFDVVFDTSQILPLDRKILSYFPGLYYQMIPFWLKKNDSSPCSSAEITKAYMTGPCATGSYVTVSPTTGDYTYSGFIQFTLNPTDYNDTDYSEVVIGGDGDCYLNFNVKCGTTLYGRADQQKFAVSIPIVEEAVMPDEDLKDSIERQEEIAEQMTIFDRLNDALEWAQWGCNMVEVLEGVISSLVLVLISFAGCVDIPLTKDVCLLPYIITGTTMNALDDILKAYKSISGGFCGFVTCDCTKASLPGFFGNWEGCVDGGFGKFSWASFLQAPTAVCSLMREGVVTWLAGGFDIPELFPGWNGLLGSTDLDDNVEDSIIGGIQAMVGSTNLEMSQRSWIMASLCACLPGLIYNAHKWREIECWRGVCYRDIVPTGVPKSECTKQYEYMKCSYLNPLAGVADVFMKALSWERLVLMFSSLIAEQWPSLLWGVTKHIFHNACKKNVIGCVEVSGSCTVTAVSCKIYSLMAFTESTLKLVQTIQTIADTIPIKDNRVDWCDYLLNPEDYD